MTADLHLPDRLLAHVRATQLFPEPGLALLAVSGGPDSLALLSLLRAIAGDLDLTLAVGHVDHGILPDSAALAARVRGIAERYGLPFHVRSLGLGPDASETEARPERYRALRALQAEAGARYLVTAHHADDQIETVLLRVLKGSGVAGLAGIAAAGPRGLVRPLLPFRRQELTDWLRGTDLSPFDDPSNTDLRGDRAWVRHRLLPELRARFGGHVDQRLLRLAHHAGRERRAWYALLPELPRLDVRSAPGRVSFQRVTVRNYPDDLALVALHHLALSLGCVVGLRRAERLLRFAREAPSGRLLQLGRDWVAEVTFDRVRILRRCRPAVLPSSAVWGEGEAGSVRWGDWELCWRPERAGRPSRRESWTWVTRASEPGGIRAARAGDRLLPVGGTGHRPLRRLFMEARVPATDRVTYPVLVRGTDIVWVPCVGRAAVHVPEPGAPALRLDARRVGEQGRQ